MNYTEILEQCKNPAEYTFEREESLEFDDAYTSEEDDRSETGEDEKSESSQAGGCADFLSFYADDRLLLISIPL